MFRIYIDYECGHEYRGFVYDYDDGTAGMICEEDAQSAGFHDNPKLFTKEDAEKWIADHKDELEGATVKIL